MTTIINEINNALKSTKSEKYQMEILNYLEPDVLKKVFEINQDIKNKYAALYLEDTKVRIPKKPFDTLKIEYNTSNPPLQCNEKLTDFLIKEKLDDFDFQFVQDNLIVTSLPVLLNWFYLYTKKKNLNFTFDTKLKDLFKKEAKRAGINISNQVSFVDLSTLISKMTSIVEDSKINLKTEYLKIKDLTE